MNNGFGFVWQQALLPNYGRFRGKMVDEALDLDTIFGDTQKPIELVKPP